MARDAMANPPSRSWKELWQTLDREAAIGLGTTALAKASNAKDANELYAYAMWLRWKILAQNADGRYSYVYAFNLGHMKGPDGNYAKEAAVFLYHARLALAIDGARCADRSSMEAIVSGYESQASFRPIIEVIERLPATDKAIALLEAQAIEEFRGERPVIERFCAQGTRSALQALNQGHQRQQAPANHSDKGQILGQGNTYTIDTSGIKPDLIAIPQWQKMRRKILDRNLSIAAKAL